MPKPTRLLSAVLMVSSTLSATLPVTLAHAAPRQAAGDAQVVAFHAGIEPLFCLAAPIAVDQAVAILVAMANMNPNRVLVVDFNSTNSTNAAEIVSALSVQGVRFGVRGASVASAPFLVTNASLVGVPSIATVESALGATVGEANGRPVLFRVNGNWTVAETSGAVTASPALVTALVSTATTGGNGITQNGFNENWGTSNTAYDLNGDGVVNGTDLSAFLSTGASMASGTGGQGGGADVPVMQSGTGFTGETTNPAAIGSAETPGFDADVIARWNMVPFMDVSGVQNVGVVAFHMNGIDRVEFSANGGPWTAVNTMRFNPQVNTWEYFAAVRAADYPDGLVEIRARVFPKLAGIPRVLQGGMENTRSGAANHLRFRNGMHSMWINANAGGSLATGEVWASGTGSDETGNGTQANPYRSITRALTAKDFERGTSEGTKLFLMPGEYTWNSPSSFPSPMNKVRTTNRFVTIEAAPGVSRDAVRIAGSALGGLQTRRVCVRNVTFWGNAQLRSSGTGDNIMWIDRSLASSDDKFAATGGFGAGNWAGVFATDTEARNVRDCFRTTSYARNCFGREFSDTPIGQDTFVVNVRLDDFYRNPNGDHADVMHWFYTSPGERENRIVYGLNVTRFHLQGWQMNAITNGGQRVDNIALVNVHISKDLSNVAGSWWMLDCNHLLMWNVQMPDQPMRWKAHAQDADGALTLANISVRNSVFASFSGDNFPAVTARNTHFINTGYGTWVPQGTAITTGSSAAQLFADLANRDYRAKPSSAIDGRVSGADILLPNGLDPLASAPTSGRPLGAFAVAGETE